jgi:DNA-binding beta-propeller fold protein YncE
MFLLACTPGPRQAEEAHTDVTVVYQERCASCHGERRFGGYASPLLPETLTRKPDDSLVRAIREGLPATQMPAFETVVDDEMARRLVALLRSPAGRIEWTLDDAARSRIESPPAEGRIPASVRRENLTLVVERDAGRIVVLDGDSLRELDRFEVGRVHGGPKFDRALRRVVASTRDGTVVLYDLAQGRPVARIKVGANTRNVALSPDGSLVAVANQLPQSLFLLDGELKPRAVIALEGQPSGVYALPGEERFVVALRDVPRLVLIDYATLATEVVELPEPFEDFTFVPGRRRIVASSRGGSRLLLWDLETRSLAGELPTRGLPHLFSAAFFERAGAPHGAFLHEGEARLSIVNLATFRVVKEIPLRGAGFFARTHPGTPWIWVDTGTEAIQLVDKKTLALVARELVERPTAFSGR